MGEIVTFPSNGSRTAGYLATPKEGRGPGVIVIQEWWGLVDHIRTAEKLEREIRAAGKEAELLQRLAAGSLRCQTRDRGVDLRGRFTH